jgi:hypothetical protein
MDERDRAPVGRRDAHVVVGRGREAAREGLRRASVLLEQVVGEPEVVPDVRVQRAARDPERIRLPVELDLVRRAHDERRRALEVRARVLEASQREPAVSAMAQELHAVGMQAQSLAVDRDRILEASFVGRAPSVPDDVGLVRRVRPPGHLGRREIGRNFECECGRAAIARAAAGEEQQERAGSLETRDGQREREHRLAHGREHRGPGQRTS